MRLATLAALFLVLAPAAALAQARPDFLPQGITVNGQATIKSAPDMATIKISLRGDGKTSDAASTDLAAKQHAVIGGLASLDRKMTYTTSSVAIAEIRRGDCAEAPGDTAMSLANAADALSDSSDDTRKGPCRIIGYVASIEATVEMNAIDKVGTAIGLAGRLGASSATLEGFDIRDKGAAQNAAMTAAVADARKQALMIAAASGAKLGPVVSIVGGGANPMVAEKTAPLALYDVSAAAPPPVAIDVSPRPVETSAQVLVVFALEK